MNTATITSFIRASNLKTGRLEIAQSIYGEDDLLKMIGQKFRSCLAKGGRAALVNTGYDLTSYLHNITAKVVFRQDFNVKDEDREAHLFVGYYDEMHQVVPTSLWVEFIENLGERGVTDFIRKIYPGLDIGIDHSGTRIYKKNTRVSISFKNYTVRDNEGFIRDSIVQNMRGIYSAIIKTERYKLLKTCLTNKQIIDFLKAECGSSEVSISRNSSGVWLRVSIGDSPVEGIPKKAREFQKNLDASLLRLVANRFEGGLKRKATSKQQMALVELGLLTVKDLDHAGEQARIAVLERDLGL